MHVNEPLEVETFVDAFVGFLCESVSQLLSFADGGIERFQPPDLVRNHLNPLRLI